MAEEMVVFGARHDRYNSGQYAVIFHCDHLIHLRTLLAQVFLRDRRSSFFRVVADRRRGFVVILVTLVAIVLKKPIFLMEI